MDTSTAMEVVDDHLRRSRETLSDLISRRRELEAELDEILAEREDVHFDALIGHDHATLHRLIAIDDAVRNLRAENKKFRAGLAAVLAELEG